MKILGSSISSHLPHLGLLRLGLFLMIVEAIVEAGLTEKSKQGLFGTNGTGGDNVGESLEDKLRQHLASAANTTRVRVALHHYTTHPYYLSQKFFSSQLSKKQSKLKHSTEKH